MYFRSLQFPQFRPRCRHPRPLRSLHRHRLMTCWLSSQSRLCRLLFRALFRLPYRSLHRNRSLHRLPQMTFLHSSQSRLCRLLFRALFRLLRRSLLRHPHLHLFRLMMSSHSSQSRPFRPLCPAQRLLKIRLHSLQCRRRSLLRSQSLSLLLR